MWAASCRTPALRVADQPASALVVHCHTSVATQSRLVPQHERPVQIVERAGGWTRLLLHVVAAALAIVGHAVDVVAGRRVRLGSENAAVGKDCHAVGVRQLDPFDGVGISRHVPLVDLYRADSRQEREVPVTIRRWI